MNETGKNIGGNCLVDFTISAPGKLILFGEHSVVYGKSALAACINRRTFLQLKENNQDSNKDVFTIRMKALNLEISFEYKHILSILNQDIQGSDNNKLQYNPIDPTCIDHDKFVTFIENYVSKYNGELSDKLSKQQQTSLTVLFYILRGIFNKEDVNENDSSIISPVTVDIHSELAVGAGTGSSASFCVCIAAAFYYYKNIKKHGLPSANGVTFDEKGLDFISKWAYNGEKILHGKPSGIDNTVTTFGSFVQVLVQKDPVTNEMTKLFKKLSNPPTISVLLINTGILRNTSKMVEKVVCLKSKFPGIVDFILNGMDDISLKATELINKMRDSQISRLSNPDFCYLETLVDMNQGLLYSLGASHECLEHVILICSRHGLHAKLTGAGGGGYAFSLVPPSFDTDKLNNCISELHSNGYNACVTELGSNGVRVDE